jgi:hypothetical protein
MSDYSSLSEHTFAFMELLSGMLTSGMLSRTGELIIAFSSNKQQVLQIPNIRIMSSFFSSCSMA